MKAVACSAALVVIAAVLLQSSPGLAAPAAGSMRPPTWLPLRLSQFIRQDGRIVSLRVDLAAGFADERFVLRVVRERATATDQPWTGGALVYELRGAMAPVASPVWYESGVHGALATWSGVLHTRLWKGGCAPGRYMITVDELRMQDGTIDTSGGSFVFSCRS